MPSEPRLCPESGDKPEIATGQQIVSLEKWGIRWAFCVAQSVFPRISLGDILSVSDCLE